MWWDWSKGCRRQRNINVDNLNVRKGSVEIVNPRPQVDIVRLRHIIGFICTTSPRDMSRNDWPNTSIDKQCYTSLVPYGKWTVPFYAHTGFPCPQTRDPTWPINHLYIFKVKNIWFNHSKFRTRLYIRRFGDHYYGLCYSIIVVLCHNYTNR